MIIEIEHPKLGPQDTRLSTDVAASATSSTVENNKSFATNDYTVFGVPAEELTEIIKLTSTTGNTTIGHTTGPIFAHSARTPIYQIKYNQVKIYSASSESGSYSLLATVDLTLDQPITSYDDTAGTSSTWYKIRYYNATTTSLSSLSVAVQGTGYEDDSLKSMTDEVLEDFGDTEGKELTREQVAKYLKGGVRKVTNQIFTYFPEFLKAYTTDSLTNGTATYTLPTNFLGFVRVDVNPTGTVATNAYKAEFTSEFEGESNTVFSPTNPQIAIRGANYVIRPTPSGSGMAFIWYWKAPTSMSTEASEHGLPYGSRDILVNYALYKAWLTKDEDTASTFKSLFKDSMEELMEFLAQGRQKITSPKVQVIFGEDMYDW
jgi:hypothetical protein